MVDRQHQQVHRRTADSCRRNSVCLSEARFASSVRRSQCLAGESLPVLKMHHLLPHGLHYRWSSWSSSSTSAAFSICCLLPRLIAWFTLLWLGLAVGALTYALWCSLWAVALITSVMHRWCFRGSLPESLQAWSLSLACWSSEGGFSVAKTEICLAFGLRSSHGLARASLPGLPLLCCSPSASKIDYYFAVPARHRTAWFSLPGLQGVDLNQGAPSFYDRICERKIEINWRF